MNYKNTLLLLVNLVLVALRMSFYESYLYSTIGSAGFRWWDPGVEGGPMCGYRIYR